MSEYWKSTPKYLCKDCNVYVRDTKLERANHEATARHQNNRQRTLRNIHKDHEREQREKERAKREIERLNGVVGGKGPGSSSSTVAASGSGRDYANGKGAPGIGAQKEVPRAEREKQLEQLAQLGVAIPDDLRSGVAIPGEWTVTATRVIHHRSEGEDEKNVELAVGTRKRDMSEEEKEAEEAIRGLTNNKRPKRWGRDSKDVFGKSEDEGLDELLRRDLVKREEVKEEVKEEVAGEGEGKTNQEDGPKVKTEENEESAGTTTKLANSLYVKKEEDAPPLVMFKKRKPKNLRQK